MSTLRKSLIPVDPYNVSDAEASNVLAAIRTLGTLAKKMIAFLKHNGNFIEETPLKPAELTKYWNGGILDWFTFLFDYYHPSIDADFPDRWTTISYVSCVFTYFIKADFTLVSETPGAARLATRLWLVKDYDHMSPSEYSLGRGWWDPALELVARNKLEGNLKKEFYEVDGVRRKSMIQLILNRMEMTTEAKGYHDHQQHLRLLGFLDKFDIVELSEEAAFTVRIAHVLSKKTVHLVRSIDPREEFQFPTPLLFTCLLYFQRVQQVLVYAQSIEAVATVTRSGLLGAFVAYSRALSLWKIRHKVPSDQDMTGPAVDATIKLITKTIPRYMVFSSVLSAIEEEKDLYKYDMSDTIVGQRWDNLCRLFESNKEFLDNTNLPCVCYCDNLKHDVSYYPGSKFRECSGCEKAKYCSKRCQREDWNAGHRKECRTVGALKDDIIRHHTLRKKDQISVCRFAIMTTRLQWESIKARARREHPNLPLSQITIFFDFTRHPHVIHLREHEADPGGTEAARHVPNATVVQCYVTLGRYKVTVTAVGDIDDIESKSWVTRAPEIISRSFPMSQLGNVPKDARISVDVLH